MTWQDSQRPNYGRRSLWWYIGAASVLLLSFGFALWTTSWSFVAVLIIGCLVYFGLFHKNPTIHRFTITQKGYFFDTKFIPWQKCSGFWLLAGNDYGELHIQLKNGLHKHLMIRTADIDLLELRNVLLQFIPEFPHRQEYLIDTFIRICKI